MKSKSGRSARGTSSEAKNVKSSKTTKKSSKSSASKKKYCLCRGDDDGRFMIACDACNDWFHLSCVGMTKATASKLKTFVCPPCSAAGKVSAPAIPKSPRGSKSKSATKEATNKRTRKDSRASGQGNKRRRKEKDDDEENEVNESDIETEVVAESETEERETASEDDEGQTNEEEEEENEYEKERKRRMEENQLFLQSLGLGNLKSALGMSTSFSAGNLSNSSSRKYTGKRQRWSTESETTAGDDSFEDDSLSTAASQPLRKSRRLQNEPALDYKQIREQVVHERAVIKRNRSYVPTQSRGYHGNARIPPTEDIVAPFSLASVGTTVWSLGHLYEGDHADKYYSSKQCMYRHPYPVGYRASAVKWGSIWIMEINEGADGPLFVVRQKRDDENEDGTPCETATTSESRVQSTETSTADEERESEEEDEEQKGQESFDGDEEDNAEDNSDKTKPAQEKEAVKRKKSYKRFEGGSATQPWTKACVSGPSPGSRVSGPLLFGFSDPLTVHLLKRLQRKTDAEDDSDE